MRNIIHGSVLFSTLFLACAEPTTIEQEDENESFLSLPEEYRCSSTPHTLCLLIIPTQDALDTSISDDSAMQDNLELEMWHRSRFGERFHSNIDLSPEERYARVSFYLRDRIEEDLDTALLNSGLDDLFFEIRMASPNWPWIATNQWTAGGQTTSFEGYPTEAAIKINANNFYEGLLEHTNIVELHNATGADLTIVITENYAGNDIVIPHPQLFENTIGGQLHGSWDPNASTAGVDDPQFRIGFLARKKIARDFFNPDYFFSKIFGLLLGARPDQVSDPNCDRIDFYFYGVNRCAHFEGQHSADPTQPLSHPFRTVLAGYDSSLPSYQEQCPYGCPTINLYSGNQSNSVQEYSTPTFMGVYPGAENVSNNRCIIREAWPYVADFSETLGISDLSSVMNNPEITSTVDLVNRCQ